MKLLLVIVLAGLATFVKTSIIPANHPITTTIALPAPPVATSYQVVSRNVNRVIVPHVPTVAYPGYASAWGTYPYNYRFGYGYVHPYGHHYGYGYGYGYPYGATVW